MKSTVRFHMNPNEANLAHNSNENVRAKEPNTKADPKTGHVIEKWCCNYASAEEAIADILHDDLETYNKKVRKSRRMTMEQYIQKVKSDKRGYGHKVRYKKDDSSYGYKIEKREEKRILHEVVVSCGNVFGTYDAFGKTKYDKSKKIIKPYEVPYEVNYAVCKRYYETFEKRNPNFKIVSWYWHNDEGFLNKFKIWEYGTPHGQGTFIAVATGYKQGLEKHISTGRALENMGFKDTYEYVFDENGNQKMERVCAYTHWERAETEYLEQLFHEEYEKYCKKHKFYAKTHGELEIIHPVRGKSLASLSTKEFSDKKRQDEQIADFNAEFDERKKAFSEFVDKVVLPKKVIFNFFNNTDTITLNKNEYEALLKIGEMIDKMEFSRISSSDNLKKSQEEFESAEKTNQNAKILYDNEDKFIQQQAAAIAANMLREYEEETEHKKEEYIRLVEKKKIYILNQAKKVAEKISAHFANLDEQEKKKLLLRTYNELGCDKTMPDESELSC